MNRVSVCDWAQGVQVAWEPDCAGQTGQKDVLRISRDDDAASQPTALRDNTEVQVPHTATTAGRDNYKVCIGVALVGADVSVRNDTRNDDSRPPRVSLAWPHPVPQEREGVW